MSFTKSGSRTMEDIKKVINFSNRTKIIRFSFSYRLKLDPYGIKALFGIYLSQIDDSKIISRTIHASDLIHVTYEDSNFWGKN
jgi:hypothetical protein